jgi:hypothetical protein
MVGETKGDGCVMLGIEAMLALVCTPPPVSNQRSQHTGQLSLFPPFGSEQQLRVLCYSIMSVYKNKDWVFYEKSGSWSGLIV